MTASFRWTFAVAAVIITSTGCGSKPTVVQFRDSGPPYDVGSGDGAVSDGSSDDSGPSDAHGMVPEDRLYFAVDASRGVALGSILAIRTEVARTDFNSNGYDWRVFADEIDIVVERGVGVGDVRQLTVLAPPSKCEAYTGGVLQPDVRTSVCVPRESRINPVRGDRLLGIIGLTGDFSPRQMSYTIQVDAASGLVDLSPLGLPSDTVEGTWNRILAAWARRH
jgi:hypothetical protein